MATDSSGKSTEQIFDAIRADLRHHQQLTELGLTDVRQQVTDAIEQLLEGLPEESRKRFAEVVRLLEDLTTEAIETTSRSAARIAEHLTEATEASSPKRSEKPSFAVRPAGLSNRLDQARRALMAPHDGDENKSFVRAIVLCNHRYLDTLNLADSDFEGVRRYIETINQYRKGPPPFDERIAQMSYDERRELRDAIDGAASWFEHYFWTGTP